MSEASVMAVLKALLNGKLLTAAQRKSLDDDCLGWDCSVLAQNGFRGKSGGLNDGAATLETYAGVVRGVPFVVAVNSAVPFGLDRLVGETISSVS